ncbi:MAG: DMT family transporter [Rhodoluna sp.]|nr:DMT family transporter [Rhodoluna sp.]
MNKKHPTLGAIYALMGALLFGINASTSKVIMATGVEGSQIVLFRSFATAGIAALVLLFTNRGAFKVQKPEWPKLIGFGIVGVALMQWAYSMAVANLQVGIALLIEYTAIVWVPIAAMFIFKEKVRGRIWIGVALVLAGLVVVSNLNLNGLNMVGVAFAFMASATLTVYFIMGERTQHSRDTMSTLFYTMAISTVFWLVFSPWWNFDWAKYANQVSLGGNLASVQLPAWVLLIWLGVMGSFVPMLLSYKALTHLSATGVGIASTAETVFAFVFGLLWLGEQITTSQLIGGLLVIAGIIVSQTARQR